MQMIIKHLRQQEVNIDNDRNNFVRTRTEQDGKNLA